MRLQSDFRFLTCRALVRLSRRKLKRPFGRDGGRCSPFLWIIGLDCARGSLSGVWRVSRHGRVRRAWLVAVASKRSGEQWVELSQSRTGITSARHVGLPRGWPNPAAWYRRGYTIFQHRRYNPRRASCLLFFISPSTKEGLEELSCRRMRPPHRTSLWRGSLKLQTGACELRRGPKTFSACTSWTSYTV